MTVECNVCKKRYEDWHGSTECCGSIAFIVENGIVTTKISLFGSVNNEPIEPIELDLKPIPKENQLPPIEQNPNEPKYCDCGGLERIPDHNNVCKLCGGKC